MGSGGLVHGAAQQSNRKTTTTTFNSTQTKFYCVDSCFISCYHLHLCNFLVTYKKALDEIARKPAEDVLMKVKTLSMYSTLFNITLNKGRNVHMLSCYVTTYHFLRTNVDAYIP